MAQHFIGPSHASFRMQQEPSYSWFACKLLHLGHDPGITYLIQPDLPSGYFTSARRVLQHIRFTCEKCLTLGNGQRECQWIARRILDQVCIDAVRSNESSRVEVVCAVPGVHIGRRPVGSIQPQEVRVCCEQHYK